MKKALWVIITVTAVLCSCRDSRTAADQRQGDTLRLKYAEKLTIVRHEGFTEVLLADPWMTLTLTLTNTPTHPSSGCR